MQRELSLFTWLQGHPVEGSQRPRGKLHSIGLRRGRLQINFRYRIPGHIAGVLHP